jgi:hypothetical protein
MPRFPCTAATAAIPSPSSLPTGPSLSIPPLLLFEPRLQPLGAIRSRAPRSPWCRPRAPNPTVTPRPASRALPLPRRRPWQSSDAQAPPTPTWPTTPSQAAEQPRAPNADRARAVRPGTPRRTAPSPDARRAAPDAECKKNGPQAFWLIKFWCLMINTTCGLICLLVSIIVVHRMRRELDQGNEDATPQKKT